MPWKCPACQTQIAHDAGLPQPRRVYRCHVCRLELVFDEHEHKLTVAPFSGGVRPTRRATDKAAS